MNDFLPGIDLARALRLTGADYALYLRFLRRFPQDDSLLRLRAALAAGDAQEAFCCAHTLKGISLQLGITALSAPAGALCDILRTRDPAALPRARLLLPELTARHAQIVRAIRAL